MIALGVTGCATSPTGRDQLIMFPSEAMRDMGAAAFDEIKAETPVAGAYLNRYVECVADADRGGPAGRRVAGAGR